MNQTQQSVRVGLFFLLGIALVWVTFETLSGGKISKKGYNLVATFDDLKNLKVGDDVRMAGVKIGSVAQTRLAGRNAEAVLRITPEYKVPNDSVAAITMSGLLGGNYVGVSTGTPDAPPLGAGASIKTKDTPDMNTIMTEFGDLGQKLNGALGSLSTAFNGTGQDGGLFQKLDRLVTDNREKLGETISNMRDISAKINGGQGTLGKLLNDSTLHDQLLAAVTDIKSAAGDAKSFMADTHGMVDQVKSGKGALGVLLYDQQAAENVRMTAQNIRNVSDKLARGEGTLGKLINDDSLYNNAQITMKKADRALDGLNDSGPIQAVGVLANSLF